MSGNRISNHTSKGLDDLVRIGHERRGEAPRNDDCKYRVRVRASAGTDAGGTLRQISRSIALNVRMIRKDGHHGPD
jgi:hypothetical protein